MRVIAHSVFAPLGLLLFLAAPVFSAEPVTTLAQLASSLSQNNAVGALEVFDSTMPGYGAVESNIGALVAQSDILCSIDVVEEKDTADGKDFDVDWYMQLKSQASSGRTERRRERIVLHMRLLRGRWKINSVSNLNILSPITVH